MSFYSILTGLSQFESTLHTFEFSKNLNHFFVRFLPFFVQPSKWKVNLDERRFGWLSWRTLDNKYMFSPLKKKCNHCPMYLMKVNYKTSFMLKCTPFMLKNVHPIVPLWTLVSKYFFIWASFWKLKTEIGSSPQKLLVIY